MVSFLVRMTFDPADHDTVADLLRHLTEASRKEPGCISYISHFVEGEDTTVVIYEQYVDQAALELHRASPHFHRYAIGGLNQTMKDRHLENLTAVC